jgi:3-methyladenine DNA glycosylase AlkC
MPEPFKNLINPELVRACGSHLQRVWPGFDRSGFERQAIDGLGTLEMKARAMHVADALEATLPTDFDRAGGIIELALAPATPGDSLGFRTGPEGLAGWIGWPLGEFVARRGQDDPVRGLQALHAITQRFTGEFAIRAFLLRHFDLTLRTLSGWCDDDSAHVRRLVSEGSRPRLPWGLQVKRLIADPSPTLPLLERLQDDASGYVRRSVANHLNDISRDHPAVLADWLDTHLPAAAPPRRGLLRHASRTLLKRGDQRTLRAWGLGRPFEGTATLTLSSSCIRIGERVRMDLALASTADEAQTLVVDYTVHHVRANGSTSPKVFKGWSVQLAPFETRMLPKQHSFRPVTTRRYHPGDHRIEVHVNGTLCAGAVLRLCTHDDRVTAG